MKKLISLLAVFALLAALPLAVFADPAVTLKMEDVSVVAGTQTVTLTLICQSSVLVGDGQVTVTFPADKLQLTKAASPLNETAINTRKATEGRVQFGFMTGEGLGETETLLTLSFMLKNPEDVTSYTVTAATRRMSDLNYHNLIDPEAGLSVTATVTVTEKPVDPEILELREQLAGLIGQQIDESKYTPTSVAAYKALAEQADQLLQSVDAAALQGMIDQLNAALVELPPVDPEVEQLKEELTELIGEEIDEDKYTPESVEAYKALAEQAAALVQSENATAAALQDMIGQLRSVLEEKPAETVMMGDVDGDGGITSTDARLVLQLAVDKIEEADMPVPAAADVDGDGSVTSTDARLILQKAVGKIQGFENL